MKPYPVFSSGTVFTVPTYLVHFTLSDLRTEADVFEEEREAENPSTLQLRHRRADRVLGAFAELLRCTF